MDDVDPESDAFAGSEFESGGSGAVGCDEGLSNGGGGGAHADVTAPYLSCSVRGMLPGDRNYCLV